METDLGNGEAGLHGAIPTLYWGETVRDESKCEWAETKTNYSADSK
jgi:hypothetical protein